MEISTGKQSKLQDAIDQLNAGKTVEEVRNEQIAKSSGSKPKAKGLPKASLPKVKLPAAKLPKKSFAAKKKFAMPKPKPIPQPVVQEAEPLELPESTVGPTVLPGTEDVQTEPEKPESKGGEDKEVEDILSQIKAARSEMVEVQSESLLQLDSDIKIEPEAKEALGYLVDQFPSEYIDPKDTKKAAPKALS